MLPIAQAQFNLWNAESGTSGVWTKLAIGLAIGFGFFVVLFFVPTRARKPIGGIATFLAASFWVLRYFWPVPINRKPGELPNGPIEGVGFWIEDAVPIVGNLANILTAFLLGLGIYSLLRIHVGRIVRRQRDWQFSIVLIAAMFSMVTFGYLDWLSRLGPNGEQLQNMANWTLVNFGRDLLFDGMLQEMEAAMFSIIAFFILSAAYRAFRVRSIEATILLATALVVMLSLMGAVAYQSNMLVDGLTGGDASSFVNNFRLTVVAKWIADNIQTPGLRAVEFGISVGALAMGLRLMLSLEKQGAN